MSHAASAVLVGAIEGTVPTREEQDFFGRTAAAGLTLFGRNIVSDDHASLGRLTQTLQRLRPAGAPPLVIAIDQEGGRVRRLKEPFPNAGPALQLAGGSADSAALREISGYGQTVGMALRALGVNVNFAPVLDVLTEPTNLSIGDRAFGVEAVAAAARAGAFLHGQQSAGVMGCLKHFPGQGDARVDTHLGGAVVDLPLTVLHERELLPFKALLHDAPMVMISHGIYPQWDATQASRSPRIMQGLLREELGFKGVVVSDDMNMGAIPQDLAPWQEAIVDAVAAGADMILVCRHLERCQAAYEALVAAAARSPSFAKRLHEAAGRVTALRARLF